MSSQFEILTRDDRGSVTIVIKFLKGGVFLCPFLLWISREECLLTCSGILGITRIILRITHFLHNKIVLVCNILMWEEICKDPLALCPTYLIFRKKLDAISLVSLALGVRVVLFYSDWDEVSSTEILFWLFSAYLLCCDTLVVLMVLRLISLGGCFPPPPISPTTWIIIGMEDW